MTDQQGDEPDIQPEIDKAVLAWCRGKVDKKSLRVITDFLEEFGGVSEGEGEEAGIFISPAVAVAIFDGLDLTEVAAELGLEEGARPTKEEIDEYLAYKMERAAEDSDDSCAFSSHLITSTDGAELILVATVNGYSFSGVSTTWYGPYDAVDEFVAALTASHWLESSQSPREIPSAARKKIRDGTHRSKLRFLSRSSE